MEICERKYRTQDEKHSIGFDTRSPVFYGIDATNVTNVQPQKHGVSTIHLK